LSYDLKLFRVPEGSDACLVYQQITERDEANCADLNEWLQRPVPESVRAEMRRIADVLKCWRPALEEFRPASPLPWIELNDEDLSVQFEIYDGIVAITIPYFGDRVQALMECVTGCFEPLQAAAGYIAFDPQLGRVVASADLGGMMTQYQRVDDALEIPHISSEGIAGGKRSWWKFW
jgi:hypothetical protein